MELSTDDFIEIFGEELQTRQYDELIAERYPVKTLSNEEILEELGNESYKRFTKRRKDKGIKLKDLAKSCGLEPRWLREGVREGSRFPNKPGAFDKMCRQLDFQPSEARTILGGIYEAKARGERIEARMSINEKLQRMHAVYQKITDPAKRSAAEAAIDGLWDFLNKLAYSQG